VKGKAVPVRFEPGETEALNELSTKWGLPVADIIRRSVRLFYKAAKTRGKDDLIAETAQLINTIYGMSAPETSKVAEDPPAGSHHNSRKTERPTS
jgi:hypothetical protein